mmetsp:Transcript_10617/g.35193  ORF Transcript_10617/g.35193 Transcript_10617/m.35193 type:complete len:219 (-) Transcript_10617:1386-2042(-)
MYERADMLRLWPFLGVAVGFGAEVSSFRPFFLAADFCGVRWNLNQLKTARRTVRSARDLRQSSNESTASGSSQMNFSPTQNKGVPDSTGGSKSAARVATPPSSAPAPRPWAHGPYRMMKSECCSGVAAPRSAWTPPSCVSRSDDHETKHVGRRCGPASVWRRAGSQPAARKSSSGSGPGGALSGAKSTRSSALRAFAQRSTRSDGSAARCAEKQPATS